MNFIATLCSFLILVLGIVHGRRNNDVTMEIEGKIVIPDGKIAAGYTLALNGEQFMTIALFDGSFSFPAVPSGIYLLEVLAIHEHFSQMKIQVNAAEGTVKVVEYDYPGAVKKSASYPLVFTALAPINYFQVRPKISILGFVMANPMMLIMGFSAILLMYMPKMLKNLDPEAMKAYEEAQKDTPDPAEIISKMFGK